MFHSASQTWVASFHFWPRHFISCSAVQFLAPFLDWFLKNNWFSVKLQVWGISCLVLFCECGVGLFVKNLFFILSFFLLWGKGDEKIHDGGRAHLLTVPFFLKPTFRQYWAFSPRHHTFLLRFAVTINSFQLVWWFLTIFLVWSLLDLRQIPRDFVSPFFQGRPLTFGV
jgi:hypothetical protein